MSALEFRSAAERSSPELAALFTRGYERYYTPVAVSAADFENMVFTTDLDLAASRLALEGGSPVAFAFLGVRGARGWVGGMGVVPESRGRGFGLRVMERLIDSAIQTGMTELDLEVLVQNTPAASIYEELGFRDRRRLDVWVRDPAALPPSGAPASPLIELPVAECLELHERFHPARPPWQRALESLERWAPRLSALGARDRDGIRGWVMYRPAGERLNLADLAIRPGADPAPIVDALAEVIRRHPQATTTLVNLPSDDPFAALLPRVGAAIRLSQREMSLAL